MQHCVKVSTPRGRVVEHHKFESQTAAFERMDQLEEQYHAQGYIVEYYNSAVLGDLNYNTNRTDR